MGRSACTRDVSRFIGQVASSRIPVLIQGETGTGKELVARIIHAQAPWREEPFIPVDCPAVPPTLIESELFGYARGAFTGAERHKEGLVAAAKKGTLFLDEIAELPTELQTRFLRVSQEREYRPIGSTNSLPFEGRIIAASNCDLGAAIREGRFRKDLYFRLNVASIMLTPLRERKEDIPLLVDYFLRRAGSGCNESRNDAHRVPTREASRRLLTYEWPGNIRELSNCIERAVLFSSGNEIGVADLHLPSDAIALPTINERVGRAATLREMERSRILQVLEHVGGDKLAAAHMLGVGKTTIYRKLKEYRQPYAANT